jgi:hypothetical protein
MRKKKFDEAAINCIIKDSRPFYDFRQPGMTAFLKTVVPGYEGPHERTVQRSIKRIYSSKMWELKNKLNDIESLAITTDLWKRPNKHYYLCVTAHFVYSNFKFISTVFSFHRFTRATLLCVTVSLMGSYHRWESVIRTLRFGWDDASGLF